MARRFPISIAATDGELTALKEVAEKLGFNRSEIIEYAVNRCKDDPDTLVKMFKMIMDKAASGEAEPIKDGDRHKTSITLEEKTFDNLESMAGILGMTRNMMLSVIIRGIVLGAV